jgi:DivIVA domain-containing protein
MPLTPEDVQNKRFRTVRGPFKEGYDEEEVDAFLDDVEAELRRLLADNETAHTQAPAAAAPVVAAPTEPVEEPNEAALRTLLLAQRTGDEAIAQAKAEADQIVSQAKVRASSIESEAQQQHAAAMAELQRQRGLLEGQIEELRTFEREYRTRMKAYLEAQLRDIEGRGGAPSPGPAAAPTASARPAGSPLPSVAPDPPRPAPSGPPVAAPAPAATPPAPAPAPSPAATSVPPPLAQGPASPFTPAPRLVEDVDSGSDTPIGPPREAGEDGDLESDDERA